MSPWQFKNLGRQRLGRTKRHSVEVPLGAGDQRCRAGHRRDHNLERLRGVTVHRRGQSERVHGRGGARWYSPPAVHKDQVVVWYRLHPKDANCAAPLTPRNSQFPADAVFGFALLTSMATVTVDIGLNNRFEWNAPAGVSIGEVAFLQQDSQIPFIQIIRNSNVVASGFGSAFVTKECQTYNFNSFVDVVPNE
ncbi:hypothetical protein BDN71DRAFT_1590601 [Pleurotus eryngii]|uniref:Uncharacterized protein n=1 Tax=Pleurotus eryngii TaxID=5323 RepID=A0A9P5ZWW8_PLEER|nr:hypothetical protein BDN71DRAFT_1590601 [Pleurotus eryngii]